MNEKIIIYGMSKKEFPKEKVLLDYLLTDLSIIEHDRFRYTKCKDADIIVISQNGLAYGHLIVDEKVKPNKEDINEFPPVKRTYLVNKIVVYKIPIKLYKDFGIRVTSFGKYISKKQFLEITKKAN